MSERAVDCQVTVWEPPVDQWRWRMRLRYAWWSLTRAPRCVRFTEPHRTRYFYGYDPEGDTIDVDRVSDDPRDGSKLEGWGQ